MKMGRLGDDRIFLGRGLKILVWVYKAQGDF